VSHPGHALVALIVGTLVLRLAFAASLGLGIDESYTAATARQPQLAYFDHPPAAWWLVWAAGRVFGVHSALGLRLPFILLFALSSWLMFALTRRLFDEWAAFWATATLNCAPVLAWTSGSWIVPDGPLNAALLAGTYCTAEALLGRRSSAGLWWFGAGACGGLALLCKLHGAFLFAGVGLFLLTTAQHRRWLASPWPYAGAGIAVLVFLPVLVWNQQHAWVSFTFQAGRARYIGFDALGPVVALLGHAVYLLPWVWLPLLLCLAKALARGPHDERRWLMACLAAGPIVVFAAVAFTGERTLPHWAAAGYLMLFPLLGAEVAEALAKRRAHVRAWLTTCAVSAASVLTATVVMAWLPWPSLALPNGTAVPYPLLETIDWNGLERELASLGLLERPNVFIAATRWHEAGKIDYALRGRIPVTCLCRDPRGYGILVRPEAFIGRDAVIIGRNLPRERIAAAYGAYFAGIDALPSIRIMRAGAPAIELSVFLGHALRAANEQPNLLDPLSLRQIDAAGPRS
jgi:4-amino-4-deoxy-L-arabinose transferase-like glycosyltransferase